MRVFRQVVDSGSFTAAAHALNISVAMASKHVMRLEEQLGTKLLHRTSRRLSLNTAGSEYYERCCEILDLVEEAESSLGTVGSAEPEGTLRLTAPTWFGNRFFAAILNSFSAQFPRVQLDISLSDGIIDLVEEGLDVALRVTEKDRIEPRLRAQAIGEIDFIIVASKQYVEEHGQPESLDDFKEHQVLEYSYAPSEKMPFAHSPSNCRVNSTVLIGELAAHGAGIAILPRVAIIEEVYRDQLIHLLPDVSLPTATLFAVSHGRRHRAPRVQSFIELLSSRFHSDGCSG